MDVFNLFGEQDWDRENERDGYRHKATVIGQRLGASLLGGTLYELPPGEKTWPYHFELGAEEWLIAVSGRRRCAGPTASASSSQATSPSSLRVLRAAHSVINRSGEPCRVLLLSSKSPLAVVHYPDSRKVGVWTQVDGYQTMLAAEPKLDYWEGES